MLDIFASLETLVWYLNVMLLFLVHGTDTHDILQDVICRNYRDNAHD